MIGITSYSKVVMRLATFAGFLIGGLSFAAGLVYLILKLMYWDRFSAGVAPMVIGVFFLGALQLFFIGFLGEYVLSINTRVLDRPLVVEEERLNFQAEEEIEEDMEKLLEDVESVGKLGETRFSPEVLAALQTIIKQYADTARDSERSSLKSPEKQETGV